MAENTYIIDNISPTELLGVQNKNIRTLSDAFPNAKIIARGNTVTVKGNTEEAHRIFDILDAIAQFVKRYGEINDESMQQLIHPFEETVEYTGPGEVLLYGIRGNVIKPKSPNQQKLVDAVMENDLVFALGPAGTGKTFISVALAVRAFKNREVKKIILTRPAVEAGESLGFLPGDLTEKIDPYLRPIYDALDEMIPPDKLKYYRENKIIEIAPLAYMRGRTLNHAFVILDEAQNTTAVQLKMFLTRMGPNCKVMVNGDRSQVDLPHRQQSGLMDAIGKLKDIAGIGVVELNTADVNRHRLVKDIIRAYDNDTTADD